jgi:anti-anti-sigma factor
MGVDASPMSLLQLHRRTTKPDVDGHDFQLRVEPGDDVTVITVTGELDLATVPAMRGALLGTADRPGRRLVLDLSGVTFIDSVGVGAVLHAKRRLGPEGGVAVVLAPDSYARVIFDVVGADRVLPVSHDLAGALAAVAG